MESTDELVSVAGITREPGTSADQCFLEYAWVAPEFRRRDGAFNLINEVPGRLQHSGVRTVYLWVLDGNGSAMRLYERLGFVSCNHRQPLEEFPGRSEELQTVADLARELLKLSDSQLQSLRSLATAASEPTVAAMLSRLAAGRKRRLAWARGPGAPRGRSA